MVDYAAVQPDGCPDRTARPERPFPDGPAAARLFGVQRHNSPGQLTLFAMKSGTYEAIGPHFQSNPYNLACDKLVRHGADVIRDCPRTFEGLRDYLQSHDIEGVVFWLDGEPMCKIKRGDYGFKWPGEVECPFQFDGTPGIKMTKLYLPKLPRLCYTIAVTTYNRLFEEAIENYGLVTTSMARKMGIEPGALVDLAYRGRLTRIGQGVYQLVQYAPGEKDPYAQAVALVGDGSYLYGESVIAMLGLAPTDPDRIYVATANRVRRNLGCGIKVVKSRPEYQPIAIEGIPSQRIQDAIVCAKTTMPSERLHAACKEAFRIGKIDEKERKRIEREI